jgi:predicted amidohydrolase
MRLAVVQFAATSEPDDNLKQIEALVRQATSHDVSLVVLPEAAMHDFGAIDLPLGTVAQDLDGPFVSTLARLATEAGVTVVGGMFERSDDPDRPYNTVVAVGPTGEMLATYRKSHLYDSFGYRESDRLMAGEPEPVGFDVDGHRVGLVTCYDIRFPEFARLHIDAGADVLAVTAAWMSGPLKEDHWATLLRARAIENTAYVVGAGQTGRAYSGSSMVVDPMGVVIARMGDETGVIAAEVSADRLHAVRDRNPSLANRRLGSVR